MTDDAQGNDNAAPLRESLRRLDAVLNFARKLVRENGEVPPGLVEDFREARKSVEKEFVFHFQALGDDLQRQLRELIKATRDATARQITANVDKLSQRTRRALNQLVIHTGDEISLTSEVSEHGFSESAAELPQFEPSPPRKPKPSEPAVSVTAKPAVATRRALVVIVSIGVLAVVALAVGYLVGPWTNDAPIDDTPDPIADVNAPARNKPKTDQAQPPDPAPFDARAGGYVTDIRAQTLSDGANPLATNPDSMIPDDLTGLMLGLEQMVNTLEPDRLKSSPQETRQRLSQFAKAAESAAPGWIESQEPLLEAFIAFVKQRLQLAAYPADDKVLLSDVLYAAGGGQLALTVTLGVLAHACNAPLRLIAPHGPERPLISIRLGDEAHTYNGETFGLRTGMQPALLLREMMVELAGNLRPTLQTREGRLFCSALLHHYEALFTVSQARDALRDFDLAWLNQPGDDADERELLRRQVALRMQPVICDTLLKPVANGDADEALAILRMSQGVGDAERTQAALLLLGERAKRGVVLDGQPLALVVGDLLLEQQSTTEADKWFRRAMDDHPQDPRPVMRLLARADGDARLELMREAYARGERTLGFMRVFAKGLSAENGLSALALFDQILRRDDYKAHDVEQAGLHCLSMGRTDWALERLRRHGDLVNDSASLQRLELICELSSNGLTARAEALASALREQGKLDSFVENLLQRYGG